MNYRGVIIEESLDNLDILKEVEIVSTKVEPVTEKHKTPRLGQWTLHTVEIPEEKADQIAEMLSQNLQKEHFWYAYYKNDLYHYVIYRGKMFKVDLKNPALYKDAKRHGVSLGIPEYQVDFAPEDNIWER